MSGAILVILVGVVTVEGRRRGIIRGARAEQRPLEILVGTEETNLSNDSRMSFVTYLMKVPCKLLMDPFGFGILTLSWEVGSSESGYAIVYS